MQSRRWSLIEAGTNVVVGLGVSLVSQLVIFQLYGVEITLVQNLKMVFWFTLVSIVRSYVLRRIFNKIRK